MKKFTIGQILNGIKKRDNKILTLIYKDVFPVVRHYVTTHGGSNDDAKDVFQESIIIIYKQLDEDKINIKTGFEAYVYGISRQIWLKILRRRDVHDRNVGNFETETITYQVSDEMIEDELEMRLFRRHFANLGKECQEVLKMITDGVPYEEIAKKMKYKGEKIIRNKKYKCKEKLIQMIKDDPEYQQMKKDQE